MSLESRWGEMSLLLEIGKVHREALRAMPPTRQELLRVLVHGYEIAASMHVVPAYKGTEVEYILRRWRERFAVAIAEQRSGVKEPSDIEAIALYDHAISQV